MRGWSLCHATETSWVAVHLRHDGNVTCHLADAPCFSLCLCLPLAGITPGLKPDASHACSTRHFNRSRSTTDKSFDPTLRRPSVPVTDDRSPFVSGRPEPLIDRLFFPVSYKHVLSDSGSVVKISPWASTASPSCSFSFRQYFSSKPPTSVRLIREAFRPY